jgi:hypothetical protein
MQQAIRMNFPQSVHDLRKDPSHIPLGDHFTPWPAPISNDELLQTAAALVGHDHVHRVISPQEVHDPHHIRMQHTRQRPALFKEALQSVLIRGEVVRCDSRHQLPGLSAHQRAGQVFFERYRTAFGVVCQIHDRKAAAGNLSDNAIAADFESFGQGSIGLGRHKDKL